MLTFLKNETILSGLLIVNEKFTGEVRWKFAAENTHRGHYFCDKLRVVLPPRGNHARTGNQMIGAAYFPSLSSNFSAAELIQYLRPVGAGPSSNTCPRCAAQRLQVTSVRTMPLLPSKPVLTFSATEGLKKLGQPVWESNFASELKSSAPQQTHL